MSSTSRTPLTGRDTAAAFRGLIVGALAIATIVLSLVAYTNNKFADHEPASAEATP